MCVQYMIRHADKDTIHSVSLWDKSMRQTMKEIEVNVAYRWFLRTRHVESVPHFSTFGKNYTRRSKIQTFLVNLFKDFEDCMKYKLVNTDESTMILTHVKACANGKSHVNGLLSRTGSLVELNKEIEKIVWHGKKPLRKR